MKKIGLGILVVITVLAASGVVTAGMMIPVTEKAKEKAKAPEKSPVIAETEDGNWDLERIDFIHYAKPDHPGKPPKEPKAPKCYKLFGLKWKSLPVDYVINPTNPDGLLEDFVTGAISTSAETWDDATASELFGNYTIDYNAKYGAQNYKNEIAFGDYYFDPDVIAATTIWWSPRGRRIVEFDIAFETNWTWGDATTCAPEAGCKIMDLQNIATHELGHGVGLDDIYDEVCSEVTMYGYSVYGETKKRTLAQPDATGIQELYGE